MKMKLFIAVISLCMTQALFAQSKALYSKYVAEADSLYELKAYAESAAKYKEAFDQLDGKAYSTHRYNAACSYALAGNQEQAFYHLFYLAENPNIKYKNLDHITKDKDLEQLHAQDSWTKLIVLVQANKYEAEKYLDKPLVAKLDSIYELDQALRKQIPLVETTYGRDSKEMKAHWKKINETDKKNLVEVKKILDERGWLGPKVVGRRGNSTLFLVIQHSDLETQLAYLPMMREAVKQGNAKGSSLALLEDRVALGQGKKQIYGSQVGRDPQTGEFYVAPLIEPEKVNERRASVGLRPIEDYVSRWGVVWDVEKHKARSKRPKTWFGRLWKKLFGRK